MSAASSAQARSQPKGILKKPTSTFSPPHQRPDYADDQDQNQAHQPDPSRDRNRALLQSLLATHPSLLNPPIPPETFELLSTLPHAPCPPHSAAHPSQADAQLFLTHLRDFRPGEYLDLIEERNCLGRCGYALCPRPRRTLGGGFKLVSTAAAGSSRGGGDGTAAAEPGFARTEDLNKWCSDACARRALYLKVQLDNPSFARPPGWTAGGGGGGASEWVVKLELRAEGNEGSGKKGALQAGNHNEGEGGNAELPGGGADQLTQPMAQLNLGHTTPPPDRGSEQDRQQLVRAMAQLELDKAKQAKRDAASALAADRGDAATGLFAGHSKVEVTITEKSDVKPPQPPRESQDPDAHLIVEGYRPSFGGDKKLARVEGGDSDDDDDDDDDILSTIRF